MIDSVHKKKKYEIIPFSNEIMIKILKEIGGSSNLPENKDSDSHKLKCCYDFRSSINYPDDQGNTLLHIACAYGNLDAIKIILSLRPNLFLENNDEIRPIDMCEESHPNCEQIKDLIYYCMMKDYQIIKFKNTNASSNPKDIDFKLIAMNLYCQPDDQPIEKRRLLVTIQECIMSKKTKDFDKIKSLIMQGLSSFYVQTLKTKHRHYLHKITLKEKFRFLKSCKEGILSIENSDCQNILHFAVFFENIKLLKHLLDGDERFIFCDKTREFNIATPKSIKSDLEDNIIPDYVMLSLRLLDKPTKADGLTPLLAACVIGNLNIIKLILKSIKRREKLIDDFNSDSTDYLLTFEESLELTTLEGLTPFLLAAKYGHLDVLKYLHGVGANIFAVCNKVQNALHYAVLSMDIEIVDYLVYLDSDSRTFREQFNIDHKRPGELDSEKLFEDIILSIWDRAKLDTKEIREGLKLKNWHIDEQSYELKNSPLHIATIYQNCNVIKYLLRKGADYNIQNREGFTPIDIAKGESGIKQNKEIMHIYETYCNEIGVKLELFKSKESTD